MTTLWNAAEAVEKQWNSQLARRVKWLKTIGASAFNIRLYGNNLFRLSTIKEERGIDYPFSRKISASIGIRF